MRNKRVNEKIVNQTVYFQKVVVQSFFICNKGANEKYKFSKNQVG